MLTISHRRSHCFPTPAPTTRQSMVQIAKDAMLTEVPEGVLAGAFAGAKFGMGAPVGIAVGAIGGGIASGVLGMAGGGAATVLARGHYIGPNTAHLLTEGGALGGSALGLSSLLTGPRSLGRVAMSVASSATTGAFAGWLAGRHFRRHPPMPTYR